MPVPMKLIFALLGLAVMATGLWLRHMGLKAASWPSVEGEIVASALEVDAHDADSALRIMYRYSVAGHTYTSARFSFGAVADARKAKERMVAAYPVGKKMPVYYDPANPKSAVLEREPSAGWLGLAAVGAAFVAIAAFAP